MHHRVEAIGLDSGVTGRQTRGASARLSLCGPPPIGGPPVSRAAIGRIALPAALFIAGLLAASALSSGAGAAPAVASSALTRVASCNAFNFHPINSQTSYDWSGRWLYRSTKGGDGWFVCDPNLPNKATVTRVRFTVRDNSPFVDFQYCGLARSGLTASDAPSGDAVAMGMVQDTGMSDTPGTVRRSDSTISVATIDESNFTYWLQCRIALADGDLDIFMAKNAGIIGADVTYTISSTNG